MRTSSFVLYPILECARRSKPIRPEFLLLLGEGKDILIKHQRSPDVVLDCVRGGKGGSLPTLSDAGNHGENMNFLVAVLRTWWILMCIVHITSLSRRKNVEINSTKKLWEGLIRLGLLL